ncbi:MAG: HAMP domain-containing histidine kinase [Proteobacteria bacterium]|nr:HAMP domain-containing histidine kinase [Pseudomonadota bacterium]
MKPWRHARRRLAHSLRARLLLLFVLLALATAAVFLFGMQRVLATGWQGWARPLASDYVDRLAAELGSPPDADKARALVQRLPITVRIDGPRVHFDSHPGRYRDRGPGPGPGPGPGDGDGDRDGDRDRDGPGDRDAARSWAQVRHSADGHRIVFGLASLPDAGRSRRIAWTTLAVLLALTLLAYAVVHRLLRPLRAIGDGVARFGRGQFEPPIAVPRPDELGELAGRVNRMAASLRHRLEDQRALLLAISHELRSPLTRARLNAELVDDGPPKAALLRDLAEMRELITSLLEGERIAAGAQALQLEPVDLAALARALAADRDRLDLALADDLPPVQADATRLKLLLRNLLDNARRHGGGDAAAPAQLFLRREDDGRLALGVRDHGPGVPDEQLPRLAQAFYRPDSARTRAAGGVGLGLYLCRLVAQAHGGELRIRNAQPGLEVAMVWAPTR